MTYGLPEDVFEKRLPPLLKEFRMEKKLNWFPVHFSKGMRQKVMIMCAFLIEPPLYIVDEPFVGLDPKAIFDMKEVMQEMAKDGKTIFFSTHILDMAEKLCTRVAIVKKGQIIKVGKMKDVKGDKSLEKVFLELEK